MVEKTTNEKEIAIEPKLEKIRIDSLKFDPTNPNRMNQTQMKALENSILRFGNVVPVIIDQNNMVIDGEHRVRVYQSKLGLEQIPVYRLNMDNDMERKLLRQTLNKLKGFHDPIMDAREIEFLKDNEMLSDLSHLIAAEEQNLEKILRNIQSIDPVVGTDDEEEGRRRREFDDGDGGNDDDNDNDIINIELDNSNKDREGRYVLTFRLENFEEYELVMSVLKSVDPSAPSISRALVRLARLFHDDSGR